MTDSFGTFLKGVSSREMQDSLSLPRLILAAVVDSPQTDAQLVEDTGYGSAEVRKALQLLAGEGLVTAKPQKGGLLVEATSLGKRRAAG